MKKSLVATAILPILVILLFLRCDTAAAQGNPVLTGADPDAITVGKEYWIYPTNSLDTGLHRSADRFYAYSSKDLTKWEYRGQLIQINEISWIKADSAKRHQLWAPDVLENKGKFYLYYSVGPQTPTPSRLGVAVSDYPSHGFKDVGRPLLTGGNGFEAIDPMVFIDPKSGNAYLYTGGSAGAKLRVFQLKPNLTEIDHEIMIDQPPMFTEGVFMHVRNGIYYLSYSHGRWNDATYSVHYATSKSPVGPWQYHGPILVSDSTHKGPGHHSFVVNPSTKQWYIVYHRWEKTDNGPFRGSRKTAIEPIAYAADGTIVPIKMTDVTPKASPIR